MVGGVPATHGTEDQVTDRNSVIDRYIETWNEADEARRRTLIDQLWTEDGRYLDPLMAGEGHDGINTMIGGFQTRFPGVRLRRTGAVDAHHDRVRFAWEFFAEDGSAVAGGIDIGVVAGARLHSILGFIDFAPASVME